MRGDTTLLRVQAALLRCRVLLIRPSNARRLRLLADCRALVRDAEISAPVPPFWLRKACASLEAGDVAAAHRRLMISERRLRKNLDKH